METPVIAAAVAALAVAYMVPSLVAYARAVPNTRAIVRLNACWGWTGICWFRALGMALVRPPAPDPGPAGHPPVAATWQARSGPGLLAAPRPPGAAPPLPPRSRGAWTGDPAAGSPAHAQATVWWQPPGPPAGGTGEILRYPGPAPVPVRRPNGPAVAGMVLGILAMVFEWFGLLTLAMALAAVVLGAVGINRSAATASGRGQGIAGVVLGITGLAAYILWGAISMGFLWLI
jgi:Superinfection immunity protein